MHLFTVHSNDEYWVGNIKRRRVWDVGVIPCWPPKFGKVDDWYDGPITYIHLGVITIGIIEDCIMIWELDLTL